MICWHALIFFACGRREALYHQISLAPVHFIEVPVPRQQSEYLIGSRNCLPFVSTRVHPLFFVLYLFMGTKLLLGEWWCHGSFFLHMSKMSTLTSKVFRWWYFRKLHYQLCYNLFFSYLYIMLFILLFRFFFHFSSFVYSRSIIIICWDRVTTNKWYYYILYKLRVLTLKEQNNK